MIVPAYNAEPTLSEAVQSALSGSYPNIELIIVDDGSTDDTFAIAQTLARADARIHLHRQPNGGVSAAFNAGLALVRGDYVARLDSDDIWHPRKIERQVDVALRHPRAAFIYTFVRYIDAQGRVTRDGPDQRFPLHALSRGVYESLVGANSSALMLRSTVQQIGGYDEELVSWEDLFLQLRITARAEIAYVPEYLVGYRVRPGSLSADPANMIRSWRKARRKIQREFPELPSFVDSWSHGRRCAGFAESFAWRGHYAMCARLLAEAARMDWRWTAAFLAFRSKRRLKRAFVRDSRHASSPPFSACDPQERVTADDPNDVYGPLDTLEAQRIAKLGEIDAELARARTEAKRPPSAAAQESFLRERADF